jgi:RNA polymerase sigma factor (sigma-70 family)
MEDLDVLVDAARAGGDWAFARLWEELSPAVAGYLRARSVAEVDDVTSEVFLAAFQGISSFEGNGVRFRSWLFTIAHHRGVDSLRRHIRSGREIEYIEGSDERTVCSAEDTALGNARSTETRALLNHLTAEQREVLVLRFVADLSLEEVAAITGRKIGAVKQLQRRGIAGLRRHLNGPVSPLPVTLEPVDSITGSR